MPPLQDRPDGSDLAALIADFLRCQLGLPEQPPRVVVYNSGWPIPSDNGLYVVVGVFSEENFGEGSGYGLDPVSGALVNNQIVEQSVILTIDLLSASTEARRRTRDVFFAFTGDAAEWLSEQYNLRIFRPEQFIDLSHVEASKRLNRFQTRVAIFQGAGKTTLAPSMTPVAPYVKTLIQA